MHGFSGQIGEKRHRDLNDKKRKEKCKKGNQSGFNIKLCNQLFTKGTDRFTNAYFLCSFFRPGRTQVHEIDTGQQQNKNTYDPEQPDILYGPATVYSIFK